MSSTSCLPLRELIATKSGSVDPSKFTEEIFDLYSIPAFDRGEPEIATGAAIGSAKQIVEPGDVLLSRIVPHIRRAWIVGKHRGRRLIASGEWIVFRSERASPDYLRQVLVGDPFHAEFMNTVAGVGGSLLRARPAHVAKISIPLPSLPQQRRIADILDQAEALRAKRRAALAELDTLTRSLFLDLFGDPKANPKAWPEKAMTDLFATSPIFGTMIPPVAEKCGWLALRVGNIQDWTLDLTDSKYVDLPTASQERHAVNDGDLLMARAIASQDHLGKCVVAHPNGARWAFDSHLMRLRFDQRRTEPEFIRHLLMTTGGRSLFLKSSRKSTVQFNINTKEVSALRIPLPPIELQCEFTRCLCAVEKLKTAHRTSGMWFVNGIE